MRITIVLLIMFSVAGCSNGHAKRATEDEGPISARARNALANHDPEGLLRVGEGFEKSGNFSSALNIYGQAMAADPTLVKAQVAYARILGVLGSTQKSLMMLSALVDDYPTNIIARKALISIYIKQGDFKAASLFLPPLLANSNGTKHRVEVLILAARLNHIGGDKTKSKALFEQALAIEPKNHATLRYLAMSFALEKEYRTAIALLQKSMDTSDGLIPSKKALAEVYALSGQLGAAMQIARNSMPIEEANSLKLYYRLLPTLLQEEQAKAVMFNYIPAAALKKL